MSRLPESGLPDSPGVNSPGVVMPSTIAETSTGVPTVVTSAPPRINPFAPISADLDEVDKIYAAELAGHRSPVAPLMTHLRHYRGKRLRPALLLLSASACGGVRPSHHVLAAAAEMIHTATLVHDDVLDESDVRRHSTTFNAEWGNKIAILLGDMLFTRAFHLTSTVDGRACQLIGEATNRVCAGELRQVCERGNLNLKLADYYAIVEGKTAALTEVCGRLGALYAGASEDIADRLATYGRCLGISFQIADDLLDITGDPSLTGKTLGTDLEQGKLTLPLIHALETLPASEADDLRTLLGSVQSVSSPAPAGLTAGHRERVADTLIHTGSLVYARKVAEDYSRQARAALDVLPRSQYRFILEQITEWSTRREK